MPSRRSGLADPVLLAEVGLVLLLFGLSVPLFLVPVARADSSPDWWAGFILAILFFAVVFLDAVRRRRKGGAELQRALDEAERHDPEPHEPGT